MAEWEAEIRIRRNGRCVQIEKALGSNPVDALYFASNDLQRWAEAHADSQAPDTAPRFDAMTDPQFVEWLREHRPGQPYEESMERET